MEIKNKIIENNFNLEIYKWDDLTLDILKLYSDWKCKQKQEQEPITIKKQSEEKVPDKNRFGVPLFSDDEILCNDVKYGSTNLYKPILKHILDNTGFHISKGEVTNLIYNIYKDNNRRITKGSAGVYSNNYCKYMLDNELIRKYAGAYDKIKKKPDNKELTKLFTSHKQRRIKEIKERRTKNKSMIIGK